MEQLGVIGCFTATAMMLGCSICSAQVSSNAPCLAYEPSEVRLTGSLERQTFPGPPNYESVRNGDPAETYWLLKLTRPVCVTESKTAPDLDSKQDNINRIQLVLTPEGYSKYKSFVGSRVEVTGTLFGAITGHHHTPVLLEVKSISKPFTH